jgi:hypothetical protein
MSAIARMSRHAGVREALEAPACARRMPAFAAVSLSAAALGLTLSLTPWQAAAQPARQPPATPAAPALDPAQAASKLAYDRLDEAERKAIQNDLIWTGDFNGVAGGEFGKRTYDAMLAFERRSQGTSDGILTPPERAALTRAADQARQAIRFAPITDQSTGIRIGLPAALLPARVAVENGVVYRRPDGAITLQLTSMPPAQAFDELFERLRQDGPGRKVTYRLKRPDWFVISGEEGGRRFYTRLAQGPGAIRGYTFRYPVDQAASLDRIMIAIANSFEPFPGTDVAANPARVGTPPATVVPGTAPALIRPEMTASEPRHAVSGVSVGPGKALTSAAALASCAGASIAGKPLDPAQITVSGDVALLGLPDLNRPALLPSGAEPGAGGGVAVFTLSFEDSAARSVMVSSGRWQGEGPRVASALQIGAGGAPVLDGQGRLVGLVRESPKAQRMVAGVLAESSYGVIPLAAFRAALPPAPAAAVPPTAGASAEPSPRLLNAAAASLVEIRCSGRR